MKWMYASVVAVVTGVCSTASSQSVEPGSALFQSVQYSEPGYGRDYDASSDPDYQASDSDQEADRDQDGPYRDREDTDRAQGDGYGDPNASYGDQFDGSSQRDAEHRRGYQDGYRERDRLANRRVNVGPRIDHARFERCSRRYRTFDPASGTYMGFDGRRHVCS